MGTPIPASPEAFFIGGFMQELTLFESNVKMTSLDIAEITRKQHSHIMRDIRQEIEKLKDFNQSIFGLVEYKDQKGEKRPCYEFGKDGAMQLALKYDAVVRYKLIKKIEELEQRNKPKLPQTFAQALRLAADQAEIIESQKQIIAEAKPKVDYVDKILKSKSLVTVTQIAKDYGLTASQLNKILAENKIQYKQSKQWLLYKEYASKSFTQSETFDYKDNKGDIKTGLNTKWTIKGRLFIHDLLKGLDIHPNIETLEE